MPTETWPYLGLSANGALQVGYRRPRAPSWLAGRLDTGLGLDDLVKELECLCAPCLPCVMARTEQSRPRHNTTADRSS